MDIREKLTEKPCYITELGDFNRWPEPREELELEEGLSFIVLRTYHTIEYRQITDGKRLIITRIFWADGSAVAIGYTSDDHKNYKAWRIGCQHIETESINLGRCYNQYKCLKCGYSWTVDSSD